MCIAVIERRFMCMAKGKGANSWYSSSASSLVDGAGESGEKHVKMLMSAAYTAREPPIILEAQNASHWSAHEPLDPVEA
jgi:hypothetical protein